MTNTTQEEPLARVASRLREMDRNWRELAEGIGISPSYMTFIKKGERPLLPEHQKGIAIWCHRTEAELFGTES